MVDPSISQFRRISPRVAVDAFCTEYTGTCERHAVVVNLSEQGLQLRRPEYGPTPPRIQIEFELPDIDEVIWTEGVICHEYIEIPERENEQAMLVSGAQIVGIADSQRRLLREYVHYLRNEVGMERDLGWSSYLPGVTRRN